MNLPNALTISRIFLIPVLLAVLLPRHFIPNKELWAVAIVVMAGFTDMLDGYLARRFQQVSTVGMLLDPIADKLLVSASFISLVELQAVPAWMAVIIVGREFAVSGLRNIAASQGFAIQASDIAKAKMVMQVVAIVAILLSLHYPAEQWLHVVSEVALVLVVVFAIVSAVGYFRRFWKQVDMSIKSNRRSELLRRRRMLKKRRSDATT